MRSLPALLLALFLALPPAAARDVPLASYLQPAQADLTLLLTPPPAPDSPQQAADLAAVRQAAAARTPERVEQARRDANEAVDVMFGALLGPAVTPDSTPSFHRLFDRLGDTEEVMTEAVKHLYNRTRPYVLDPSLGPAIPRSRSGSYPSGHATRVTMAGLILAAMLPEKRAEIAARMDDYAQSRLIGGVHFPSDLAAGARAGTAIDAVLLNDPAFMADFLEAKAELRGLLGLQP